MNKSIWMGLLALLGSAVALVIVLRDESDSQPRAVAEKLAKSRRAPEPPLVERRIVIEHAAPLDDGQPAPVAANPEAMEEPSQTAEEAGAEVEARFASDQPATREARTTEGTIRGALTDAAIEGAKLENLECRASTCRAQITFTDERSDVAVTRKLLLDPSSPLGASLNMGFMIPVREKLQDGRVAATIYFYREHSAPGETG